MTYEELQTIRTTCDHATPGPWFATMNGQELLLSLPVEHGLTEEDALFIASARTDVPALLEEIMRLQAIADAAQDLVETFPLIVNSPAYDKLVDVLQMLSIETPCVVHNK